MISRRHTSIDSLRVGHEDLKVLEAEIQKEKQAIHEAQSRVCSLEVRMKEMQLEIENLESVLSELSGKCDAVSQSSQRVKIERDSAFRDLVIVQAENEGLNDKNIAISKEIADQQYALSLLQKQKHDLVKMQIAPLEKEIRDLENIAIQRENSSNATLAGVESLSLTITSLRLEYKERLAVVTCKKKELHEIQHSHKIASKELQSAKQALADTTEMLDSVRCSNTKLEQELGSKKAILESETHTNDTLLTTIGRMRDLLNQQTAQLVGSRGQMRATDETISSLKNDIVNIDRVLGRERSIQESYEQVNQQTVTAMEGMRKQTDELRVHLDKETTDNRCLEDIARNNEEKLKNLNVLVQTSNGACNVVGSKIFAREAQIEKLEYLIEEKRKIGIIINSERKMKHALAEQTKVRMKEIVSELNELRSEIANQIALRDKSIDVQKRIDDETMKLRALQVQYNVNTSRNIHPWTFMAVTDPEKFGQLQHLHQLQRKVENKQYQLVCVSREILQKEKLLDEIRRMRNYESRQILKQKLVTLIKNYKAQKYEIRFLQDRIHLARRNQQQEGK